MATQLFEVDIMIHVVVLFTVHAKKKKKKKKSNNPKGPQSQNRTNEYLRIPDAKNIPEISFSSSSEIASGKKTLCLLESNISQVNLASWQKSRIP